jgi:CDGSH iron-sulfur domain-containing protein 3
VSGIKITVRAHGSYKVEGDVLLFDEQGNQIPTPEGRPYALCRCGHSKKKPFCDGSHKESGWDGSLAKKE